MLTVLIIRGATLSGAIEGVKFYMGSINLTVLKNPTVRFIKYLKRIFSLN
jgi:SNF family Na+-dependent transporter